MDQASLYNLQRFSIDALKIDHSIVAGMTSDSKSLESVRVIIGLAGNLGLDVIAEGVEDASQLERLNEVNCAYAQGYLFSPPLTEDDAARYVRAQNDTSSGAKASEE